MGEWLFNLVLAFGLGIGMNLLAEKLIEGYTADAMSLFFTVMVVFMSQAIIYLIDIKNKLKNNE